MKTTRLLILIVMMGFVIGLCGCSNTLHVYKYGPATFSVGEIPVDGDVVCLKTKQWPVWPDGRPWPVSSSLYVLLDESAHQAIDKYMALRAKIPDPFSPSADQQFKTIADATGVEAILITNFNRIIQGSCIYDRRFRGYLSLQTKKLLKQKPQGNDLIRLNWLLLRDAGFTDYVAAIEADGDISGGFSSETFRGTFSRKESISHIEIFPKKLSETELQDIWVSVSPTNRIALADIQEDKIKLDTGSMGSKKNNSSLVLPCSIEDFEKVFGKADEIVRMTMW
jgi:hypothetical protein